MTKSVARFKKVLEGRENELQDLLLQQLDSVLPSIHSSRWTGICPTLGAGNPDVVLTEYDPAVVLLSQLDTPCHNLLSYLRFACRASLETIASRLVCSQRRVQVCIDNLESLGIVVRDGRAFALTSPWRDILPLVTAIEVKVHDWQRALTQASRNSVFCHHSYVAMPSVIAEPLARNSVLDFHGIGVLSVDFERGVRLLRRPRASRPKVWAYYYRLASLVAKQEEIKADGHFYRKYRRSEEAVSRV